MTARIVYLHEAERNLQLCAQVETDALLARVTQPEPVQMCSTHDADEPMRRSADVEARKPVHPFVTLAFGVGYLSALLFACWLAGVDVGVMHLVHWLRSVMP